MLTTAAATDPHLHAASAVLEGLALRFPDAGLAIAGSVAVGMHRPSSDVDLLVADPAFVRDMQWVLRERGIRLNLLCVSPPRFGRALRRRAHQFVVPALAYVLSARVQRDPHGHLAALQRRAAAVLRRRTRHSDALLRLLEKRAASLVSNCGIGNAPRLQRELISVAVDGWFLRFAAGMPMSKEEGTTPFLRIAGVDPEFYSRIERALARWPDNTEDLIAVLLHVFPDGSSLISHSF
jgi:hypothetical protein